MAGLLTAPCAAIAQSETIAAQPPVAAPGPNATAPSAPAADADTATAGALGDGDIVVTARRRTERLQDVPVAVSVLSGEAVREAGIKRFEDLQRSIPALQVQGAQYGNTTLTFTIRSQRSSDTPITNDPAVAVYFAEVPEARPQGLTGGMFDLSSVQVLKGPQGTLFGRNSTGGAVVLTPQAPTDRFEGYARVTLGNYNTQNAEGVVNAPLTDWAALRVGGFVNRHDGYFKNLLGGRLNNARNEAWRASLKLTPMSGLRNTTVLTGWNADETGPASKPLGQGPVATRLFPTYAAQGARDAALPFDTVANNGPPSNKSKSFLVSNITEYDVTDGLTIKNIFGYRFVNATVEPDLDGTALRVYQLRNNVRSRQYSDELQFSGKLFDQHLDYIVGAFYFREKASEDDLQNRPGATAFSAASFAGSTDNESKSVFAQATLRVPGVEKLSVTGGLRHTWDDRSLQQRNLTGSYNPVTLVPTLGCALRGPNGAVLNPCLRNLDTDFRKLTYTTAVDYKLARDVLVYATHRTGYRSGGFNLRANPTILAVPFKPEFVKDYEIGLKSEHRFGPDFRARFNIAAYYQDYQDIQRSIGFRDPVTGVFVGSRIDNAAKARIKGVEPEVTLFFGESLSINGYYSYSKGKYRRYFSPNAAGGVDNLTPSPFAGAPIHSGGANVAWVLPVTRDLGEFKLIGNFYKQSQTFGSDNTYTVAGGVSPFNRIAGYQVVNGRLEWNRIRDTGLSAALYARNIFGEKYFTAALDVVNQGLGTAVTYPADPRTFGVELQYKW